MKGTFITFEGGEGSGKSTQARLLVEHLKGQGYDTEATREPGGTPIGDAIRAILLDPRLSEMGHVTELLLLAASRAQNVFQRIRPAIERGAIVVCDRFTDSTLAYQGYGRKFDIALLDSLNRIATGGVWPDLTVLLDIDPEIGLRRARELEKAEAAAGEGDRFEREAFEFHHRLREGFLTQARKYPSRFRIIPVKDTIEETRRDVIAAVDQYLAGRPREN
ncbi:MAG TPA: dTMP kinase [bacterium]|nr:dTMP kinase [bacterium]HPQ66707.1 dTMP kinase [bacterium]